MAALEDAGFYCVDNLPPPLVEQFLDLCAKSDAADPQDRARHRHARGQLPGGLPAVIEQLRARGRAVERDLPRLRGRGAREPLPRDAARAPALADGLGGGGHRARARAAGRARAARGLRDRHDRRSTSTSSARPCVRCVGRAAARPDGREPDLLRLPPRHAASTPSSSSTCASCRTRTSSPRCARAPGRTRRWRTTCSRARRGAALLERLRGLLDFLLPLYDAEGKAYIYVGVGCTGGRHRSVAVVEALAGELRAAGREVNVKHRDVEKGRMMVGVVIVTHYRLGEEFLQALRLIVPERPASRRSSIEPKQSVEEMRGAHRRGDRRGGAGRRAC